MDIAKEIEKPIRKRIATLIDKINNGYYDCSGCCPVPELKLKTSTNVFAMCRVAIYTGATTYQLQINKELLEHKKHLPLIMDELLPHELSHLARMHADNDDTHGKEWQDLTRYLGGSGSERIDYNIQLFGRSTHYKYLINGTIFWFASKEHAMFQNAKTEPYSIIRTFYTGETCRGKPLTKK